MTVLSPHRYDNARPGGAAFLEIPDPKGTPSPAPLKETVISGEVRGPLASLTLSQIFDCSFLPGGTAAEALYRFPLPGDAMVRGIVVRFGETTIRTTLAERKEAEKTYEEAKKEGKRGALVTRESEDAVTLRVTGITSGEQVLVETGFLLWLSPLDDGFSLRVPLTIAPRYVRKDEERNPRRNAQPLDIRWDPGHRARLSLRCVGFVRSNAKATPSVPPSGAIRKKIRRRFSSPSGTKTPEGMRASSPIRILSSVFAPSPKALRASTSSPLPTARFSPSSRPPRNLRRISLKERSCCSWTTPAP